MGLRPLHDAEVRRLRPDSVLPGTRSLATETPIAISFLGIGYAVMMATPQDLEDFATGFARTERIIDRPEQILSISVLEEIRGVLVNLEVAREREAIVLARVRHRASDSSCGLCGIENLEQALRPLPQARPPGDGISTDALFQSLETIRSHQPLNKSTGAVHAAALFGMDGSLIAVREDVGRHNGFDKLIGHCMRSGLEMGQGFVLLTSRCSYELVEKAALAGVSLLVTVSAPTSLAVARAEEAGLTLIALARPDEMLIVCDPHSRFD